MKALLHLILVAGCICAAIPAQAQSQSTAYTFNSGSYSGVKGGSISVELTRSEISGPCADWNVALPRVTVTVYLVPSGTYGLLSTSISGWQSYYYQGYFQYFYATVTIPQNYYSTYFTVPLAQDNQEDYDRTGTLRWTTDCGQSLNTAAITVQDNNTPMGVGFYVGYWTNSLTVLEGGLSGANQATIYFFRDQTNTQSRTINYTLSGNAVANTDYTPAIGTITIPMGSWFTAVTISATNAAQSTTKTLGVAIASGTYKINSQNPSCTTTILPDYPTLSVQASPTNAPRWRRLRAPPTAPSRFPATSRMSMAVQRPCIFRWEAPPVAAATTARA